MYRFDGIRLLQLRQMYRAAPTAFYQTAQQLMNIDDILDLLSLASAMDTLQL
jgi:hypothetical protein